MLLGEYNHTLDDKNRVTLPAKFKSELGKKIVITRGLDRSLFIYSEKEWKIITNKLAELPMTQSDSRGFSRFFLASATEVEPDKSGRVLVPERLKSFAHLDRSVVITGVQSRVEIWDQKEWEEYRDKMETDGDSMAEKLGEIGII